MYQESDIKNIEKLIKNDLLSYFNCKNVAIEKNRVIIEIIRSRKRRKHTKNLHKSIYRRILMKASKINKFLKCPNMKPRKITSKLDSCSLCLKNMCVGRILHTPCGHSFHLNCMSQMVTSFRGNWWHKCPNCRTDLFDQLMKVKAYADAYENIT